MCLGGDIARGPAQLPFDGKMNYDYIMWIDSDILFTVEQFQRLLNRNVDVVSGLYKMEGDKYFAAVENWDEEYFAKNHCFEFLAPEKIAGRNELLRVDYTGMGFMLIKKGVFEALDYPWFEPKKHTIGGMVDYSMEDVSFCLKVKEKGFSVFVDPTIIVGHEKKVVL